MATRAQLTEQERAAFDRVFNPRPGDSASLGQRVDDADQMSPEARAALEQITLPRSPRTSTDSPSMTNITDG